jgi:glycosyltransferase involved in cell wall biosynthesis
MADAVVTCSDYVTRQWRARFPARAACIHTIGNGVDLDLFRPASGADSSAVCPVILYVGRVSPEKGVHILAQAFEAVLKQWPDARLVVVGSAGLLPYNQMTLFEDDPHIAALRTFYGRGLIDRACASRFLGRTRATSTPFAGAFRRARSSASEFKGPPGIQRLARGLPQHAPVGGAFAAEPFGLPLAEAMACGVPVIASRAGAWRASWTGSLAPGRAGDVAALSARCFRCWATAARWHETCFKIACRGHVRLGGRPGDSKTFIRS